MITEILHTAIVIVSVLIVDKVYFVPYNWLKFIHWCSYSVLLFSLEAADMRLSEIYCNIILVYKFVGEINYEKDSHFIFFLKSCYYKKSALKCAVNKLTEAYLWFGFLTSKILSCEAFYLPVSDWKMSCFLTFHFWSCTIFLISSHWVLLAFSEVFDSSFHRFFYFCLFWPTFLLIL